MATTTEVPCGWAVGGDEHRSELRRAAHLGPFVGGTKLTCLREMGKVSFPDTSGTPKISFEAALQQR